jgi:mono/diheme cytochrome c family protein
MKNYRVMRPIQFVVSSFIVALMIVPILISCEFDPPKGSRDAQADRGAEIFKLQCAPCHGMKDMPATVDSLTKPAADLTKIMMRRNSREFPVAEIARYIDGRLLVEAHGPREMPVWGEVYEAQGMDETQIRGRKGELVAYLMSIQNRDY